MMNCFEDVKRELVNGNRFARNYNEFVDKLLKIIQYGLNEPEGQAWVAPVIDEMIRSGMDPETLSHHKANIMQLVFWLVLDECPQLKHEMAHHLYNELRKEN